MLKVLLALIAASTINSCGVKVAPKADANFESTKSACTGIYTGQWKGMTPDGTSFVTSTLTLNPDCSIVFEDTSCRSTGTYSTAFTNAGDFKTSIGTATATGTGCPATGEYDCVYSINERTSDTVLIYNCFYFAHLYGRSK